jgi:hypothetical protein
MNSFHTNNDSAFWSPGEDQTAAWSETADVGYEQAAVALDWDRAGPVTVSANLLQDTRGYSRFAVA